MTKEEKLKDVLRRILKYARVPRLLQVEALELLEEK